MANPVGIMASCDRVRREQGRYELVATTRIPGTEQVSLVITPYAPLSLRATLLILLVVCIPIMAVAVVSGLLGNWYAMPASASVCLVLCLAFRSGYRRTQQREVITVIGDAVSIESGHRYREFRKQLPRKLAFVLLQESPPPAREHLFLCTEDQRIEVGEFLESRERHELADTLRDLITTAGGRGRLLTA